MVTPSASTEPPEKTKEQLREGLPQHGSGARQAHTSIPWGQIGALALHTFAGRHWRCLSIEDVVSPQPPYPLLYPPLAGASSSGGRTTTVKNTGWALCVGGERNHRQPVMVTALSPDEE